MMRSPVFPFVIAAVVSILIGVGVTMKPYFAGDVAVARAIGRTVIRSQAEGRASAAMAFPIGFWLLTLAYMVPVLGFVTWALATVIGLGAATITFRGMLRRERPVPPAAPAPV